MPPWSQRKTKTNEAVAGARIRPMSGRALRASSRIAFALCGLVSLLTAAPYVMLRGADLPVQSEWVGFVAVLGLVGVFSVTIAVLPRSWIAKLGKKGQDDGRLFSTPLKLLGLFAAIFYLSAVVACLSPNRWELNPQIMLLVCPMYIVKMTFDPSVVATFFLLAPVNAAVYGALGLTLGYAWLRFRRT